MMIFCPTSAALGSLEKWGHEARPLGKEVFLAEQVWPVLASWQLSPRSFQLPWQEQCDTDILESVRESKPRVLSC